MNFSDKIKYQREQNHLTQKELARRLGISPVGVAQWENGLRNPKHETIKRIASALGVSVTVLYGLPAKETADQQEALEKFFQVLLKMVHVQIYLLSRVFLHQFSYSYFTT